MSSRRVFRYMRSCVLLMVLSIIVYFNYSRYVFIKLNEFS